MANEAVVHLHLDDGSVAPATRSSPEASWEADIACPVCALRPIRVRAYYDDPRAPVVLGFVSSYAWCRGRHDKPVGTLRTREVPNALVFMGVGEPEVFRCRIY